MALEMILNELSLQPADSVHAARQTMATFVQTVRSATSHQVSRIIRTQAGIFEIGLAANYPLRRWLNDPIVDIEARRYVKALTTRAPYWDGLPELDEAVREHEFCYHGRLALGIGVAYLLDSLAVSLLSEECWNAPKLNLDMLALSEDGEIDADTVWVVHASQPLHVEEHNAWIRERLRGDVRDGRDLWHRRVDLFPSLQFCGAVSSQLMSLDSMMLQPVVRRLFEFQGYCRDWIDGNFNPATLPTKATPESQATLEQFGRERAFLCPDGQERIFSWHVRLTPHAWRICFYPEPETRTMIVGYIGPHLPTAKYH